MAGQDDKTIMGETALVICAHGVAGRPGAAADHAQRLRKRGLFAQVAAACLNGEPGIAHIVDAMTAPRIVVVPYLMAAGRAFRTLLPDLLADSRRSGAVLLAEPAGTDPAVADLLAAMIDRLLAARGWDAGDSTILVAAHGTPRDPQSAEAAREHAFRLLASGRYHSVDAGFLDDSPALADLLARRGSRFAIGVGLFADAGPHGADDAAAPFSDDPAAAYAGPVGPEAAMTEIVLRRAREALARS